MDVQYFRGGDTFGLPEDGVLLKLEMLRVHLEEL